ncbi:MAG: hypothetical protein RLY15_211 [Bacteroidota bacterium]|jgi:teichuronic acid biosynthesis glycosyltransferase TuaG
MMHDLISIILPVYNSEKYLNSCLESVVNQSFNNWELIIIDDCSIDSSYEICKKYNLKYSNIIVLRQEINRGTGASRNLGLKHAKGSFIAFIDSDDIWDKHKLSHQISFMKKSNCAISFHSYRLIDESGVYKFKTIHAVKSLNYVSYLKNTIIGLSTAMINTNMTGPIEFSLFRTRQDTLLWLSLLKKGYSAMGIIDVYSSYRIRNSSISSNKFLAAKKVWEIYFSNQKLGFFRSCYYFFFYAYNALLKRL